MGMAMEVTAQDIRVTFFAISTPGRIEHITAKNLRTGQQVTLPGDGTLVLESVSGIRESEIQEGMNVYPNPFQGTATLYSDISGPGKVGVKLSDAAGRMVAETAAEVPAGGMNFEIGVINAGFYTVTVTTAEGSRSKTIICTGEAGSADQIRLTGAGENFSTRKLKSGGGEVILGYTPGDVVYYSCTCGCQTTVFTDQPDFSKIYPVQFVTCSDPDGRNYRAIWVSGQWWMAENLAWLPEVDPSFAGSDTLDHRYVYGYEGTDLIEARASDAYKEFGVLYNWQAAMKACPEGWHLPSDMDWMILEKTLGMEDTWLTGWRSSGEVDRKLKSLTGWKRDGNGDNSSGFDILPAGCRLANQSGFAGAEGQTFFWTSTEEATGKAWSRGLAYVGLGISRTPENQQYGFSVRCIKNED